MRKIFYSVCLVIIFSGCFDLATRQKPPEAIVVQAPETISTKVDLDDSTCLIITLEKKNYAVTLRNKSFATGKLDSLKNFLVENKESIDKEKVMVINKSNASNGIDTSFIHMLLKLEFSKFKLVTR